jgi:hypothetical protein
LTNNVVPYDVAKDSLPEGVVLVYRYEGPNPVDPTSFDFRAFAENPLIWNNRHKVYHGILDGLRRASIKKAVKHMVLFDLLCQHFSIRAGYLLSSADESVSRLLTNSLLDVVERTGKSGKASRYRALTRWLEAVGFSRLSFPPNPYKDDVAHGSQTLSLKQASKLVRNARRDAGVVIQNLRDRTRLEPLARDPRRSGGGQRGDQQLPECGIYLVKKVIGLRLFPMTRKDFYKFRTEIRALENCPGPLEPDLPAGMGAGSSVRQYGVRGAMRWYFPSPKDIEPFVALLLARTSDNYANISRMTLKEKDAWFEDYELNIDANGKGEYKYFYTSKFRGRNGQLDDPTRIQTITPVTGISYPYLVVSTLLEITNPLREAIRTEIANLSKQHFLSEENRNRLRHLERIKDDLFIYKIDKGVRSLAQFDEPPKFILEAIKRYCGDNSVGTRSLRNTNMVFNYRKSGNNLSSISHMAHHKSGLVSSIYERRTENVVRFNEMVESLFNKTIALVRLGVFNVRALKRVLKQQGMDAASIANLFKDDNTTRWGARCSNPIDPPSGFDHGTPKGEICRLQNCVDGCPRARWLPESRANVESILHQKRAQFVSMSLLAQAQTSLKRHIAFLERLLLQWQ